MVSLSELGRIKTDLSSTELLHLQRLVGSWGPLADFCFSDLLLFAPSGHYSDEPRWVVLGQVRPTTGQTVYRGDWMGTELSAEERPFVARSFAEGLAIQGEVDLPSIHERVRVECVPVRCEGKVVAVLTRESAPSIGRAYGELERTYLEIFNRFGRMISEGTFPYAGVRDHDDEGPRVGDGVFVLDADGRVEYASPNAVSAFHRIGVHANTEGLQLTELGLDESALRTAFTYRVPTTDEVERGQDVTVAFRYMPLIEQDHVSGAVMLVRDISELRRRDRLLLTKDATIREIHHRVKNNLQTISSLLRLQGRRLASSEAKAAVEESSRRIRSIALVHETLSREAGEDVPFIEVVRPLTRMVEEGLVSEDRPIHFIAEGDAGTVPAAPATSLAVILNELLQNSVDHAFDGLDLKAKPGTITVTLAGPTGHFVLTVVDDGVGMPEGFEPVNSDGLGWSIVRTLVETELAGTIEIARGEGSADRPGTVVTVTVPSEAFSEPDLDAEPS